MLHAMHHVLYVLYVLSYTLNVWWQAKPDAVLIGDLVCYGSPVSEKFIEAVGELATEESGHKITHVLFDRFAEKSSGPKLRWESSVHDSHDLRSHSVVLLTNKQS